MNFVARSQTNNGVCFKQMARQAACADVSAGLRARQGSGTGSARVVARGARAALLVNKP